MAKIIRPSSNPAYIELRSFMKGEFLDALKKQPDTLKNWPEAQLVIFGSTVMRQFDRNHGIRFPFPGRKSSDVDIGIYTPNPTEDFTRQYIKYITPPLKQSVKDCKFDMTYLNGNSARAEEINISAADVEKVEDRHFANDFVITQHFSEAEALAILEKTHKREFSDYLPYLEKLKNGDGKIKIDLIISSSPVPTPTLLSPKPFDPHPDTNGHLQLKRDNGLNMIAAKMVRNMIPERFKPTDFIDIYNLLHAESEEPLFDFNPDSPNNHLDHLRTLIVANLPIFNFYNPLELNKVLENYIDSDENVQRFKSNTAETVSKYSNFSDSQIKMILKEVRQFLKTIMLPRKVEQHHGPLHLTMDDANFIAHINRCEVMPGFTGIRGLQTARGEMQEPSIDVELLKKQYQRTFERYPELARNINNNHYLNERMQKIKDRMQEI